MIMGSIIKYCIGVVAMVAVVACSSPEVSECVETGTLRKCVLDVDSASRLEFDTDADGNPLRTVSWEQNDRINIIDDEGDGQVMALQGDGRFEGLIRDGKTRIGVMYTCSEGARYGGYFRDYYYFAMEQSVHQQQVDKHHSNYEKYTAWVGVVELDSHYYGATTLCDISTSIRCRVVIDDGNAGYMSGPLRFVRIYIAERESAAVLGNVCYTLEDAVAPSSSQGTLTGSRTTNIYDNGTIGYDNKKGFGYNYVEVDCSALGEMVPTAKENRQMTYVWAVVTPFTLKESQVLVMEYFVDLDKSAAVVPYDGRGVAVYDPKGEFEFKAGCIYNISSTIHFRDTDATDGEIFND